MLLLLFLSNYGRIPDATRIRGTRDGQLRRGTQLFRRYGFGKSLRTRNEEKHSFLFFQPRHLPRPLVQAAIYTRSISDRCWNLSCWRHSCDESAGGNSFRQSMELVGNCHSLRTTCALSAPHTYSEGERIGAIQLWYTKQRKRKCPCESVFDRKGLYC